MLHSKTPKRRYSVLLLFLTLLIGSSSGLRAKTMDFSDPKYTKITHQPTASEPWLAIQILFYDADSSDSFFTHYEADGTHDGPAVYVDGQWVCSPDWQLAWPDSDGTGSGKAVLSQCNECNSWWYKSGDESTSKYTNTIKDKYNRNIKVTVRFYDPECDSDNKRTVTMYVFFSDLQVGQEHTVKISGRWKVNDHGKWDRTAEFTFSVPSMGVGSPTAVANGYGKMKLNGKLTSGNATTIVGTYNGAASSTNLVWKEAKDLTTKNSDPFNNKTNSTFSNLTLDFPGRTDYYNTASNQVEYIVTSTPNGMSEEVHIYQWYVIDVIGYYRPKDLSVLTKDIWNKQVEVRWDCEGANDNSSTAGTWSIYRYPKGQTRPADLEPIKSNIKFSTRKTDVTIPSYNDAYTYEVALVPTDPDDDNNRPFRQELSASKDYTMTPDWSFSNFKAEIVENNNKKNVKLTWNHTRIEDADERTYSYNLYRSADGTNWTCLKTININSSSTDSGEYTDTDELTSNHTYFYYLSINILDTTISTIQTPLPANLGGTQIDDFFATRGTYSSMVKLQWTVTQGGSNATNYIVERRPAGDEDAEWVAIYNTSGTVSSYSYDDTTAPPGSFNEYRITAWSMDGKTKNIDDIKYADGFSIITGVVSGRITYGTGTAVKNVKVTLRQQSVDGNQTSGMHSLKLSGSNSGMTYDTDDASIQRLFRGDFSFQMYIKPNVAEMNGEDALYHLVNVPGVFDLRIQYNPQKGYRPAVMANNKDPHNPLAWIPADEWSHLTYVYDSNTKKQVMYVSSVDTTLCYDMGDADVPGALDFTKVTTPSIGIMKCGDHSDPNKNFHGYLDEFRFFTKALTMDEIRQNFNHPLAGNETGLAIYYPFDEGMAKQEIAYDFSKTNGTPNGRHTSIMKVKAYGSTFLPTENQLSLMTYTDVDGNYTIRGVPFSGEGTSYTIHPELGIHEFSPTRQSRYISMSSLVHNGIDFSDISSFPVSGYIIYSGTTYPVEGVNLYVDGTICTRNGEIIETNENGEFTISVPIGRHFIQAKKNGHVFVNDGRYPPDPTGAGEERQPFNNKMTGLEFRDTTLVNFTGRIVGGDIENSYPVGFALSQNNIGITSFTVSPTNTEPYINAVKEKNPSGTSVSFKWNTDEVPVPSATTKINSTAWRGGGSVPECKTIHIETDPQTGEFSALLPPLEYIVGSMTVKNDPEHAVVGGNVTIDLTNPMREESDTLWLSDNQDDYTLYTYKAKLTKAHHSTPHFSVKQKGRDDGSFGIDSYEFIDAFSNKTVINDIYSVGTNGTITYNYGIEGHHAPLFQQGTTYTFAIEGYEQYENYDQNQTDPIVSTVPLSGVVVTINNALSDDQAVWLVTGEVTMEGETFQAEEGQVKDLKSNQLQLNDLGKATYKWKAGFPNVASPFTRTISMSYDVNNYTYHWDGGSMQGKGIILGDLPTGNNFVTGGPDKLTMILRDPPGTGSSAEWSKGTTYSVSTVENDTWSDNIDIGFTWGLGKEEEIQTGTVTGLPNAATLVSKTTTIESKDDLTTHATMENEGENGTTTENTVTITEAVTTSGESDFVGADGDVFIGQATNIIYGNARRVGFMKDGTDFKIDLRNVISTGMKFGTIFSYSQRKIETELLPEFESFREEILQTVAAEKIAEYNPEDGVGMHNDGADKGNYYLTTLSPGDDHYGEEGFYTVVIPNPNKTVPDNVKTNVDLFQWCIKEKIAKSDTIAWINNQIENWKNYLALNEREKVKAYELRDDKDSVEYVNYSFDGGASRTYTWEKDSTHHTTWEWSVKAGVLIGNHTGFKIDKVGQSFDLEVTATGGRHEAGDTIHGYTTSFSYTLAEEGSDALSVDVYRYGAFGPIFRTRGGQTCNPYEGEVKTKYYRPGRETIMEATMQIEVPQIDATPRTVSDVPTGSAANFTLQLSNASEIGEDVAYRLFVLDETNPDGALVSVDGMPLTGEGRLIKVPGSQTITKTLQLRQGNVGILDYFGNKESTHELFEEGIGIVFASDSQPEDIADTVFLKARFTPSSSPVTLVLSNSVMNTQTGTDLTLTFKDFDRYYNGQNAFRLQFKRPGDTDWTTLQEYVLEPGAENELPAEGASVSYTKSFASFSDGNYLFRVESAATYGNGEVCRYSEELPLVKDMQRPRPLGTPEPTDGILDIGDDLSVTFNENILYGKLTKLNNFTVTGVLNGSPIAHLTALAMQDTEAAASTEADITLAGKDFSFDMWINLASYGGTILSHAGGKNKLVVGTDANGKLVVSIGTETYTSTNSVPKDDWVFLTLSYKTTDGGGRLNASVADATGSTRLFTDKTVASYEGHGRLVVGKNVNGAIHELLLWDEAHDMTVALDNRSVSKNPSTRHLIGYWKMDEGEGKTIRDYARNRHMAMTGETWYLNNINKAIVLDGQHFVSINASQFNLFEGDDVAVEFWMRGGEQTGEAQLIQVGDVALWLSTDGKLQLTARGAYHDSVAETIATSATGLNDNAWHHIALNILPQGATAVYVDGRRCLTTSSSNVGSVLTNKLIVGARRITESAQTGLYSYARPFKGQIDEVRVWNATLNGDLLTQNRKVRFTGKEKGLVAYYPFEKMTTDDYNQVVTVGDDTDLTGSKLKAELFTMNCELSTMNYTDEAPALRTKPTETNVSFNYTASDKTIVIDIDEDPAAIEGCTLTFNVHDVSDENGNYSEDAIWTAFVNRKELIWQDDELSVSGKARSESSVTATVINKSGQEQMWTLSGIPSWLIASDEYGTTSPLGETQITFTVSEATPVGKYEETIYLNAGNGIDVPLTIHVTVTGNVPDWAVNPGDFENSMNLIGQLDVLGVQSEDEDDLVAAFVGEECRGVAHPAYSARYDGYFVTMDIYGVDNETVTFRAYDASAGIVYPVVDIVENSVKSVQLNFEALSLKGSYSVPVGLPVEDKIEQVTELTKGWNWLSIYVAADDMSAPALLESIADDVLCIKAQANADGFLLREGGAWKGTMKPLQNVKMYAIQMANDRTLRIVGAHINPADYPITVVKDWNWVGYYGLQLCSVGDALSGMQPVNGDMIKGQRGVAYFDTYEWAGSLLTLVPGQGYMVKSVTDGNRTFSYPSKTVAAWSPMRRNSSVESVDGSYEGVFTAIDYHRYSGNMVLVGQVMMDNVPMAGVELGIFVDDECRAATVTDTEGMAYVIIPGDDIATLSFKASLDGVPLATEQLAIYETDATIGSSAMPFQINVTSTTTIDAVLGMEGEIVWYDLSGRRLEGVPTEQGIFLATVKSNDGSTVKRIVKR